MHAADAIALFSPMTPLLANALWFLSCLPESVTFRRACQQVQGTQEALLLSLLRRNARSAIGQRYGFATIRSAVEYQARVPCSEYEAYDEAIQRLCAGATGELTAEPVLLLEPTSGSSTATKLVPYTATLKAEFQRAIAPWIADLYLHDPRLLAGQAYWSVTPVLHREARTSGGLPLGFEEESEYLGQAQGRLVRALMAVPAEVKFVREMETFRYLTLLFLLRSRTLALISVWNPTFLSLLVEPLAQWGLALADDIAAGSLRPPSMTDIPPALFDRNSPDPRRAAEIRAVLGATRDPATRHALLWPRLRLLSCWADAYAAPYARELARLFPQATVQGKGLIATEGFVSFPLAGYEGSALAVRSHFFEFLPLTEAEATPRLAHQLERGQVYSILLTTGGGLYRYRLHDLVEVVGYRQQCPLLRFLGKAAHISDHFGEKLHERYVQQALEQLFAAHRLSPAFAMLACEEIGQAHSYTLFIEAAEASPAALRALGEALELLLQETFHYRYCRTLGQLAAVRVFRIERGGRSTYLAVSQAHGQRAGDIKPLALHRRSGWLRAFEGRLVE